MNHPEKPAKYNKSELMIDGKLIPVQPEVLKYIQHINNQLSSYIEKFTCHELIEFHLDGKCHLVPKPVIDEIKILNLKLVTREQALRGGSK